jgi:hypothetical protein
VNPIRADQAHTSAITAVADLLSKLRLDSAFVGSVARAAWLGTEAGSGSVDVLALLTPEQKNQVAMMAHNRGFDVDRREIEETEEMDVIPMRFDGVRVHVLVASNALYGRMVAAAVPASAGEREIRVATAEDLAVLSIVAEDSATIDALAAMPGFNRSSLNRKLVSIGLRDLVIGE